MSCPVVKSVAGGARWTSVHPGIPCDKTLRVPLDRMQSCNQGCCLHPPAAGPVLLEDDGHVIMSREVLELSSRTLEVGLFG